MPIFILVIGIFFLFILVVKGKINAFISLIIACIFVGFAEGMPAMKIIHTIETGFGGMLGHLGLILGFGAIFGQIMADSGGAQKISQVLISKFGRQNVTWAMAAAGFVIGITLYWEVSLFVMLPIVFTIAIAGRLPLLESGIPMLAAITVSHCFLPPHPGPVAVANIFSANIGLVLAYGLIIGIPTLAVSGPFFFKLIDRHGIRPAIPTALYSGKVFKDEDLPSFAISLFTALIPVILILTATIAGMFITKGTAPATALSFFGHTDIALFLALLISLYTLGLRRGKTMTEMMETAEKAARGIAMIILIIGAGGAFKQIIVDAGVGNYVADLLLGVPISPLFLAWLITCLIRVCIGSSTITILMASGVVLPLLQQSHVSPELMVLSVACGSVFFDPPSNATFWIVKEYFNLTMIELVKVWGGMCVLISTMGIAGVMALSLVVQ